MDEESSHQSDDINAAAAVVEDDIVMENASSEMEQQPIADVANHEVENPIAGAIEFVANIDDDHANSEADDDTFDDLNDTDSSVNNEENEAEEANADDMSDGIRLISELNNLNALLNDLSGRASRIAEHLADTVEGAPRLNAAVVNAAVADAEPINAVNNPVEPVRDLVLQVVRRINASDIRISDSVLARLRRMVFRLDGRFQRRGLRLGEEFRLSNSQSSSNESRADAMSDDEELEPPPDAVQFDTNLPAEHSYMGSNMSRVSGVNYLDAGGQYNILLFVHQHILFPGEILPFMISKNIFDDEDVDATNGMLFGVCFPFMHVDAKNPDSDIYGVTCHIYEKGIDANGNMLIKSRALQRFVYRKDESSVNLQYIASHPQFKCRGNVRILPEIFLPEPLKCINMGSLNRFRENASMRDMYKRYQAASTPLPAFIYDRYSITAILEKARAKLAPHKIESMPADPVQLSFWLVRNLHLAEDLAREIFATDSVNIRMKLIDGSFKEDAVFVCRYCGNRIAECRELFAMSKYGVQTQYCNSAGYIHETNTVYRVCQDAVSFSGMPSTEFSWFPGYEWHIINCQVCTHHIGWQFRAVEPNLYPKSFYGISGSSVRISARPEIEAEADINNVYRELLRLARRRID